VARNRDDVTDQEWLAQRFESHRGHLRAVAYRMLGSLAEADAVQDAWIRLSRTETSDVDNLRAWLTTAVYRRRARGRPRTSLGRDRLDGAEPW
jgi:DNA-directed RNA polymerase specialized sigma24 family protein